MREQLVAAGMHPRQRHDRLAGIEMGGDHQRGVQVEVELTAGDGIGGRVRDEADIGEAFRAQQILGDGDRRETGVDVMK